MEAGTRLGIAVGLTHRPLTPSSDVLTRAASQLPLSTLTHVERFADHDVVVELTAVAALRARLAGYEAALVDRLAVLRPELPSLPGDDADWLPTDTPDGVGDGIVEEVQLATGSSRAAAATTVDLALVWRRQLPTTWAAPAAGLIDVSRARALGEALGHQALSSGGPVPDEVVAEVERWALGWASGGETPGRLRERTAAALIAADPAAADRRRQRRERLCDVRTRSIGDGMSELVTDLRSADTAACRATVDAYARQWKADGDPRPLGQLRALTLRDLVLRPWDQRSSVTAVLTLHADVPAAGSTSDTGRTPWSGPARPPAPAPGSGTDPARPPAPGSCAGAGARTTLVACTDPRTGRLRTVATPREPAHAARHGVGLRPPTAVDRYRPTPAHRRFVATRDRTCRFPGCRRAARGTDVDHVTAHGAGGVTDVANLLCLCRRHHRLKTHVSGWVFRMAPDGTWHVTTPAGVTRGTRPPGLLPPDDDPPPF